MEDPSTLSFGRAMVDRGFTGKADGLYYDREGVRYRCSREEGQYTYEQVRSVLQGGLDVDCVPSPLADAMVTRELDYVSAEISQRFKNSLKANCWRAMRGNSVISGDCSNSVDSTRIGSTKLPRRVVSDSWGAHMF
jgi:hypothetical protein